LFSIWALKKEVRYEEIKQRSEYKKRCLPLNTEHNKKKILKKIVGRSLYHSNSVLNTLQFIREKALLSRNYMFQKRLPLTPQLSDIIDIKHKLFDSIFLETQLDIIAAKAYGPVILEFESNLIDSPLLQPTGRFLKSNPELWDQKKLGRTERFLQTNEDIDNECLIVYHISGHIPFNKSLKKVHILDSTQFRQEAKYRKKHEEKRLWGKSLGHFCQVAKLNIQHALQANDMQDVQIEINDSEIFWKSKETNWIEMMYFPGKLHTYEKEIDIIQSKRRFNTTLRQVLEKQIEPVKKLYCI
jgi:hypothetical protein